MRHQYKKLAVLLTTAMLTGNATIVYAGPADDIALKEQMQGQQTQNQQTSEAVSGEELPAGEAQTEGGEQAAAESGAVNTAVHATVNYQYDSMGNVTTLSMKLNNYEGIGGIAYSVYNSAGGFLWWFSNGTSSGVAGEVNVVEAVRIKLTGEAEKLYEGY